MKKLLLCGLLALLLISTVQALKEEKEERVDKEDEKTSADDEEYDSELATFIQDLFGNANADDQGTVDKETYKNILKKIILDGFKGSQEEPEDSINRIQTTLLEKLFDEYVDKQITGDRVPLSGLLNTLEDTSILDYVRENYERAVGELKFSDDNADDDGKHRQEKPKFGKGRPIRVDDLDSLNDEL